MKEDIKLKNKNEVLVYEFKNYKTYPSIKNNMVGIYISEEANKIVLFSNKSNTKYKDIESNNIIKYEFFPISIDGMSRNLNKIIFSQNNWEVKYYIKYKGNKGFKYSGEFLLKEVNEKERTYTLLRKNPENELKVHKNLIQTKSLQAMEGHRKTLETSYISRNSEIRKWRDEYISKKGACEFCKVNHCFKNKEGKLISILEAHHLKPLSTYQFVPDNEKITKKSDIAFLCPTCHKLIHKLKHNDELMQMNKQDQKILVNKFLVNIK